MSRRLIFFASSFLLVATPAFSADPTSIASAFSAHFDKAFAACDVPAVLELYEDNATAIFAENLAQGKVAIEAMVRSSCKDGRQTTPPYKQTEAHARLLGPDWIMMVRVLDGVDNKRPFHANATELMHKSGGKWHYVVDHASLGVASPPASAR